MWNRGSKCVPPVSIQCPPNSQRVRHEKNPRSDNQLIGYGTGFPAIDTARSQREDRKLCIHYHVPKKSLCGEMNVDPVIAPKR